MLRKLSNDDPYEIVSQLGQGCMGHVYRATDTKLKRQVASVMTIRGNDAGQVDNRTS